MYQIVALTTTYLFSMKVGIDMMTPTIIIGAVTDKRNNTGYNPLSDMSEEQISWIGESQNSILLAITIMTISRIHYTKLPMCNIYILYLN